MQTPSRRSLIAGLSALAAPISASAAAIVPSQLLATAMAGTKTPGMAALVIRDFKAEAELVAGRRSLARKDLVAPGDRWHPGSNGKAMTATLIGRLVEKGALAWDRPLSAMLPDLSKDMRPQYRDATLPDLLSHRSGLPQNHDDTALFNSFYGDRSPLAAQRLHYVSVALTDAPIGPARGEAQYSNTGPLLAAVCAEVATGRPFETLIAQEVFKPLGMTTYSFNQYGGPREPCGHVDGRIADRLLDPNPRMFAPAGAMRFSLSDWALFCIEHLKGHHGQGRLLKQATYQVLHTGQGDSHSALGWGAAPSALGRQGPALVHEGSDGNWEAAVLLFPESGNGVVLATNSAGSMGGDKAAFAAIRSLIADLAPPAPAA